MVSVRRVAPVLVLLMALPAFAQPKQSSRPPKQLHKVGDHWTAYNPPDPSTYAANARTHTIVAGDTLWGLAQKYFNNGYLWPQLWESNTWIRDAHWIYPGDVLLVEGEVTTADASSTSTTDDSQLAGGDTMTATDPSEGSTGMVATGVREIFPVPLAHEADIYCYGYIGDPAASMPNWVEGFEDVEVRYQPGQTQISGASEGDLLFIKGGSSTGLVAGETYMAVAPGDIIKHPVSGAVLGRHYNYQGQIRVLCTEEGRARAIIAQSCREIQIGTRLIPMPSLPIPIARIPEIPDFCDPATGRAKGYIVDSLDWDLALAEGNLVQVNLGADDQLAPGDFLVVYRESLRIQLD